MDEAVSALGTSAMRSLPFVGRVRQRAQLDDALARAAAGVGSLAMVEGAAGVGKTRLCEDVIARACARGFATAWVASPESMAASAYWPWVEAIRQLSGEAFALHVGGPGGEDPQLARSALFSRAVAALREATADEPACIVLDDLHWADLPSVRLLAAVAPLLRTMPLLVLITYRGSEAGRDTALGESLAALIRHGRSLRLMGLNEAELGELMAGLVLTRPSLPLIAELHRYTGGNPLFATEVVRMLLADDPTVFTHASAISGRLPLPPTINAAMATLIGRRSAACRELLSVAAVIGDEFTVDGLVPLLGLPRADVIDLVDEAVVGGALHAVAPGQYGFTHPLARAAVYDGLGVAERIRLHRRVGEELEARRARGLTVEPAALAHHFTGAAGAGSAGKAVRYAIAAAQWSMARLAYEDAARRHRDALHLLNLAPDSADRIDLSLRLGEALAAGGHRQAAREVFHTVTERARQAARPDAFAMAALGVAGGGGFEVRLFDDAQIALLGEARSNLGDKPGALLAEVTARLSVALSQVAPVTHRVVLAEQALQIARASRDRTAIANALAAHCDAIAGPDDAERRVAESTEIVDIGIGLGLRATELLGRRLRLVALLEHGDMARADAEIEAYAETAGSIRQPAYTWFVPLWRGMRAMMEGRLDEQATHVAAAAGIGERVNSANAAMLTTTQDWNRLLDTHQPAGLLRIINRFATDLDEVLPVYLAVGKAMAMAAGGQSVDAAALLSANIAAIRAAPMDSEWLPLMTLVADVISLLLATPEREIHVLDLMQAGLVQAAAGEALDFTARRAYQRRLVALEAELAAADAAADGAPAPTASTAPTGQRTGRFPLPIDAVFFRLLVVRLEPGSASVDVPAVESVVRALPTGREELSAGRGQPKEE